MQHLGRCACCQDGYKRMVYNAVNPQTGKLEWVCRSCEYKWAPMREPPLPEPVVDDREWRKVC